MKPGEKAPNAQQWALEQLMMMMIIIIIIIIIVFGTHS
jgi:heme/copper-type cytochrome/quinol oxidase subunit 2